MLVNFRSLFRLRFVILCVFVRRPRDLVAWTLLAEVVCHDWCWWISSGCITDCVSNWTDASIFHFLPWSSLVFFPFFFIKATDYGGSLIDEALGQFEPHKLLKFLFNQIFFIFDEDLVGFGLILSLCHYFFYFKFSVKNHS